MEAVAILLFSSGIGVLIFGIRKKFWGGFRDKNAQDDAQWSFLARLCQVPGSLLKQLFPGWIEQKKKSLLRQAALAGLDDRVWTPETLLGAYLLGGVAGAGVANIIFAGWSPAPRLLVGLGLGFWYVRFRMQAVTRKRQQLINKGFPYVLDLLHLCVNSGQGINTAIQQISEAIDPGPIREEFARVINVVRHGGGLSGALRSMSARIETTEIRAVLLSLIQAIDRGAQVGDTLETQAEQLRFSRLMAVEEQIQKLPTRMTLPIILFFMPCMLIIIIGPIILSMMVAFRGG